MRLASSNLHPWRWLGRSPWLGLCACLLLAESAWSGAPGPPDDPLVQLPVLPGEVAAPAPVLPPAAARQPATSWKRLRYEGSAVLGEFGATLTLSPAVEGASRWIAQLHTRMRSRLLPDNEATVRAWFDPATARVDRFEKLKLGRGPSFKRFLFREDGVLRFRKEPSSGEDPRRHETWANERESFVAFNAGEHGCRLISDPGALVYLVSFGPGRWSEDPDACVVSGRTLYRVSVHERANGTQPVRYRLRGADTPLRDALALVTRYEVVGRPVAGEVDEPVTRMDVIVDTETELPWKVVVREGPFKFDVQLAEAELR